MKNIIIMEQISQMAICQDWQMAVWYPTWDHGSTMVTIILLMLYSVSWVCATSMPCGSQLILLPKRRLESGSSKGTWWCQWYRERNKDRQPSEDREILLARMERDPKVVWRPLLVGWEEITGLPGISSHGKRSCWWSHCCKQQVLSSAGNLWKPGGGFRMLPWRVEH